MTTEISPTLEKNIAEEIQIATKEDKDEVPNEDKNIEQNDIKEKAGDEGDNGDDDDDDGDPIPSGTGSVSKDCSPSDLVGWSEILPRWHSKLNQRPKGLLPLVRGGIPEPLRGEVWQLLSGAQQCSDLMEQYRIFLTRTAPTEQIILRDVHRTYPAHENFRSGAGSSSLLDSLFKVCKAYAVFDEEVGYCQGLSFLVAALLLHMPEEQAFCVFVRIMQHYGLRDLFRNNFDELYLKFYQLDHLLEDHMPDLHQHFKLLGIEPFTYASQWFLTVFTAKFPLNAVFYIMDIFLLDGMNTIFQIALALLRSSKQELLALDFEGVLKYFRVQMPKRYRSQENVQRLINASSEISLKRLKKHAKSYEQAKQKERLIENPVQILKRENAKLTENNLRLEQENDDLARDLVASKIQLRAQLDALEEKTETLNRALTYSRQDCQLYLNQISDMEDEKLRLEVEASQLKEVCRRELNRSESELTRDRAIIADYKKICSQLSRQLDYRLECTRKFLESSQEALRANGTCSERKCYEVVSTKADELMKQLTTDESETNSSSSDGASPKLVATERKTSHDSNTSTTKPVGAYIKSALTSQSTSSDVKIEQLTQHVDELELELARTKLALVEAECKCQQLTHDLNAGTAFQVGTQNQTSGFLGKLDLVRAAVSSRRAPSSALNKINNMISDRLSNTNQHVVHTSDSTPNLSGLQLNSKANSATGPSKQTPPQATGASGQQSRSSNDSDSSNNNNSALALGVDKCQSQC